ncbi:hypothetical protein, partial [Candidatus Accumulibacter vicinus]|uniref:hypothetical protein n=1 Tax=Candidatus Accumulibacter vicinus TaxID=2954382 RepID=UPI00235B6335
PANPEGGNGAIFNREEAAPLPESEWLSVGAITDQLEQLGKPFRTAIPVTVVDRFTDAVPGVAGNDDVVISGVTYRGKIHLVREGLFDTSAVERTFWHELLHFGLRRFMTRDQYVTHLGELYTKDEWIRNRADAWAAGEEGVALRARGDSEGYIRARGVDEALAKLAEILQTQPTGYRTNTLAAKTLRAVRSWIANMADFFGFP